MRRIDLCYATFRLATQTVAPTLLGFQDIKRCVQYLASHPHKPIFYPSNYYDGSNFIRLTWSVNQVEYHKTQNCLECHQYAYHARIFNIRRSVLGSIHTLLGVAFYWKVQIQPAIASDSTDGEIICMYKAVKKTKVIQRYMEALALYTGEPTVHCEDNTSCISVVEAKRVTPRVKKLIFLYVLYKINLTMVYLFQNMRSQVSCRNICAPNHVQVQ